MRLLVEVGLGLCGLVLVVPQAAKAGPPAPINPQSPGSSVRAPKHEHKGFWGWRHCVECQRARAKARDGVDVPPPPSTLPNGIIPGQVIHDHGRDHAARCAACQAGAVVMGPVTLGDSTPPGRAVVGGPAMASSSPAGYAVVGGLATASSLPSGHAVVGGGAVQGANPTPVGVSRASQFQGSGSHLTTADPRMARPNDPSVLPSAMIPAQTPISDSQSGRPHVISHLLGVSAIGRRQREERERKEREQHAAITYDAPYQAVKELPASMVYGKDR
jgi:hypothetical protein